MSRAEKIKEFGLEVVLADEQYWLEQGYKIDYENNLLIKA